MDNPAYSAEADGSGGVAQGNTAVAGGEKAVVVGRNVYAKTLNINYGSSQESAMDAKQPGKLEFSEPAPLHFSLLFDRDDQDRGNEDTPGVHAYLKKLHQASQQVLTVILPGRKNEAPYDYTDRFGFYTLRRFFREQGIPYNREYIVTTSSRPWPDVNASEDSRYQSLLTDIGVLIGKANLEEEQLKLQLLQWLREGKEHKVLVHHLYSHKIRNKDADLILRWIEFWKSLRYTSDHYLVTVFFCLHFGDCWYARLFSQTASCLKRLKNCLPKSDAILLVQPLSPACVDDIEPWVIETCPDAWDMQYEGQTYPLDRDILMKAAKVAFANKKKRPFSDLKEGLKNAITEAHNKGK